MTICHVVKSHYEAASSVKAHCAPERLGTIGQRISAATSTVWAELSFTHWLVDRPTAVAAQSRSP